MKSFILFILLAYQLHVFVQSQSDGGNESISIRNVSNPITIGASDKYQNTTEPSFLYQVQLELKSSVVDEKFAELEERLNKIVNLAFTLAAYKHRKQEPPAEIEAISDFGYSTKVVKKRTNGEITYIHFVTYAGNQPILGEIVAKDLTLISVSQISAILRYPLGKIVSDQDIENESATKWWLLIAIIGAGVIFIMIGWFCLFLFYNTCGYSNTSNEGPIITYAQREKIRKELLTHLSQQELHPVAAQPIVVPSDGSNPSVAEMKQLKTPKKKMQPSSAKQRALEEKYQVKNEPENIQKAINASFNRTAAVNDVEKGKSEKKRRHTKIGPITTTITNEHRREQKETSEISRVREDVETMSIPSQDGFDVSILPPTTLKLIKKDKYTNVMEEEVKSEPESDYGSSLDEDVDKVKSIEAAKKTRKGEDEEVRSRPMTAKRHRTSLFGGIGISPHPVQPKAWTVYSAGDQVQAFWNNSNMRKHPAPASPSDNEVVVMKSSSHFNF